MLADLGVVTRAEVTEIVKSSMANLYDKIKAEVVLNFADTFEDAVLSSYSD